MSVWRDDIRYKYMFMFPLKGLACKGLALFIRLLVLSTGVCFEYYPKLADHSCEYKQLHVEVTLFLGSPSTINKTTLNRRVEGVKIVL